MLIIIIDAVIASRIIMAEIIIMPLIIKDERAKRNAAAAKTETA